jgi:hypothetical protein
MHVLKSIDVLIGLTVVLLALSMAVTVVTQTLTTIVNSRGRHLRRGLVDLLQQLDPQLTAAVSKKVATGILMHPLVSGSNTPMAATGGTGMFATMLNAVRGFLGGPRLGNVVHREEFTKLLMGLACDGNSAQLDEAVQNAVRAALQSNGIENPEQTLKNARQLALQLERSQPELSNMARQNLAILHAAESDLVAKINNWFDQTMDRTSQRFTASTRAVTFVGAFIVAFVLQVDTPAIVNRLAADDALRAQLVADASRLYDETRTQQIAEAEKAAEAAKLADQAKPATPPEGGPNAQAQETEAAQSEGTTTPAPAPRTPEQEIAQKYTTLFATTGLIRLPTSAGWTTGYTFNAVLGMLLTALLLSLGAPFWYNILGQLLRLRSVLATKDDARRAERQTSEAAQGASGAAGSRPAAAPPALLAGERGDLTAIG